jgi:[ribosomal protein S5]-alanine N-acetyltransferase
VVAKLIPEEPMLDFATPFAAFPTLVTERLILRELQPTDADAVFWIMSDTLVMRYFGSEPMYDREQAVRRIANIQSDFGDQNGIRWAITLRADGQLLGTCGFWRLIKEHYRAELGYELAPAWWGRGMMTEAVCAALEFGFNVMGLHSVEAQIAPENVGSRRVLEKVGFVQEAYFRENYFDPVEERFTDTAVFSLLRSAWSPQGRQRQADHRLQ